MKLIIDIPDEDYKKINSKEKIITISCDIASAIRNGTPIPDNATNGDVIKAMFPDMKIEYCSKDIFGEPHIIRLHKLDGVTDFTADWWNAPYQKGGK